MELCVDGIKIETEGKGEPVLFVHADFVDGGMWRPVMSLLAEDYAVARFDKRGYGSSEPAAGPICRRRELETVVRALGVGHVHLVGCSNGGQSALDLTLEEPGLVRSLTLVNASPSGFQFEGEIPPEVAEMMAAAARGDRAAASELQIRIWFDGLGRDPDELPPEKLAARAEASRMNRAFVDRGTYGVADAAPLDPLDPPAVGRLSEVRAPTLVVSGSLDHSECRRAARALAAGIPGARLRIMEGCAHVPPLESPRDFAAILADFLGGAAA